MSLDWKTAQRDWLEELEKDYEEKKLLQMRKESDLQKLRVIQDIVGMISINYSHEEDELRKYKEYFNYDKVVEDIEKLDKELRDFYEDKGLGYLNNTIEALKRRIGNQ